MEDTKFNLEEIDKTFAKFKTDKIYNAVVVTKNENGVIVNIGGKNDAIILNNEFEDLSQVKIGNVYNVLLTGKKDENNVYIVSKNKAEILKSENDSIKDLKLGSIFTFVPVKIYNNGLMSHIGGYDIFVPDEQIDSKNVNPKNYLSKQCRGIVVEINNTDKKIILSLKTLKEQEYKNAESNFWKSIFINKVVEGEIEKILPYGAFVNVDGITCFIHISDISYNKINSVEEVLSVGEKRKFRVVKLDRDNKKVNLGIKQLEENPKLKELKKLKLGQECNGKVIKLLPFGVIVKISDYVEGLLHMYDATDDRSMPVHRLFRDGDIITVYVKSIDLENMKINFMIKKENL